MCGIVGILDLREQRSVNEAVLSDMNDSQVHRGPDEHGLFIDSGLGLGHRRLSIIDLSNGQQPMLSHDDKLVVVYNGEIYNFPELTKELEARGHTFRTHCDTEVILYGWREWGADCVTRFRGMFAFAIWDRTKRRLFLARDRLGIKPLYYTLLRSGWLLFSSELKALRGHPEFEPVLDAEAVEDYFALGYVPDPKTIYRYVYKLAPGHLMQCEPGRESLNPRQYWDLDFSGHTHAPEAAIAEELIDRIKEAVDIRLIADVPLGAFLSGGVDSSAVVSAMAQLSSAPVKTCSIAFDVDRYDETEYARKVAQRYGTDHYVKRVVVDDFELVDRIAGIYDEPFADSSAIPTFRVCQLAREQVTVALSGDGGDENFAGYHRHRWHILEEKFRARIPDAIRVPLFRTLGTLYPRMQGAPKYLQLRETLQGIGRTSTRGYLHHIGILSDKQRGGLYSASFRRELAGYHASVLLQEYLDKCPSDDLLEKIIYTDLKTYLPGDILVKVDRASMANSLEVRVPLLDHRLIEWITSIPPNLKLKEREGKYILKKALEPHLPHDVMYRTKKGFAVPIGEWFRGRLKDVLNERLASGPLSDSGIFNPDQIRGLIDEHQAARADNGRALWSLLVFSNFYQQNFQ